MYFVSSHVSFSVFSLCCVYLLSVIGYYVSRPPGIFYPLWKWNESGFRPPLCTYRLNWARRTSWGWWDDWDDTVLQTQDSKFEPWRSETEHATSRSRRLPTILTNPLWPAGRTACASSRSNKHVWRLIKSLLAPVKKVVLDGHLKVWLITCFLA